MRPARRRQRRQGGRNPLQPPTNNPQPAPQPNAAPRFPHQPDAPPAFLPMTPEYEGVRRSAEDQLAAAERAYSKGVGQVQPMLDFQMARLGTDRGIAQNRLDEGMSERGLLNSGVRSQLSERDIALPFGRQRQDLGLGAAQQYADLSSMLSGARLGYDQTLAEALLGRASQVAQEMPWSVPQSGYNLPGRQPTTLQQEDEPKQNRPRRNRRNRRKR